jgi:hypothetical protein
MMQTTKRIVLDPRRKALISAILTEVLHGFAVENFNTAIGVARDELTRLHNVLTTAPQEPALVDAELGRAIANAVGLTLKELGQDEFRTRTGYDYEEGEALGEWIIGQLSRPQP